MFRRIVAAIVDVEKQLVLPIVFVCVRCVCLCVWCVWCVCVCVCVWCVVAVCGMCVCGVWCVCVFFFSFFIPCDSPSKRLQPFGFPNGKESRGLRDSYFQCTAGRNVHFKFSRNNFCRAFELCFFSSTPFTYLPLFPSDP